MADEMDIEVKQGNVELPVGSVEDFSSMNTPAEPRKENTMKECNALVGIAAVVGASAVGIVTIFAIFADEEMQLAAIIVGSLCLMGIVLGALSRPRKSKD